MSWRSQLRSRRHRSYYPKNRANFLYRLGLLSFLGVGALFVLFGVVFPIFALNLPSPDKVVRREGFSTKLYDRNGALLYDIFTDQRRTAVKLEDVPLYLRQATIAIEDKNFYKHQGFDPTGILRALFNIVVRQRLQGGSTLTQQLTKNVLLSSDRTIARKIREFILAVQIERRYSKDEILQMYLNEAPYGGTAWGVETAADTYFGKSVKDLTLVESTILAGFPQRPSAYSPYGSDPKAYITRTKQVLRRMREDGDITKEQEAEALKQLPEVKFVGKKAGLKAPHFVMYIKDLLEERYGPSLVEQGGLKVTTTLDWDLQEKAQSIVSEEIAKTETLHITNGASVVIDPTNGHILAMVGSKDFSAKDYDGQYNVALALRQPGSAIKPVNYVTALRRGYTASTLLLDTPTEFPGGANNPPYKPENYDGKFRGPVQVRFALANSLNVPAVKMLALGGIKEMLKTAYNMGLTTLEPTNDNLNRFGLSLTLGGGEVRLLDLTSAYGAFANGGLRYDPVAILKVEDPKGKVVDEYKPAEGRKILDPGEAFIISNILSDNGARTDVFGPNSALNIPGRTVAAKTGTTNDMRDNWTVGWTPQVVVGVWVGNNDNSPIKRLASGISGAAPIWRRIMLEALRGKPDASFAMSDNIVTAEVDSLSGFRAHDGYASRTEYFIRGTEPAGDDPVHKKLKVCRSEGRLVTPSQIAAGDYEEKEYFILEEEDPFAAAGEENRWQKGIGEWILTQGDWRYNPPSDYCGSANPVNVEFITPKDKDQVNSGSFDVRVDPRSTADITQVEIELDGVKQGALAGPPWKLSLNNVSTGTHTIRAKARDKNGKESDRTISIGVNVPWNYSATPSPTATPTPTPSPSPAP